MRPRTLLLLCCAVGLGGGQALAGEAKVPLHVLYVGPTDGPRPQAFAEFLRKHFARVSVARRVGFRPAEARDADVVLLDWSQAETRSEDARSPFGRLEEWSKPTLLLNHAGLLLAGPWRVVGGAG